MFNLFFKLISLRSNIIGIACPTLPDEYGSIYTI